MVLSKRLQLLLLLLWRSPSPEATEEVGDHKPKLCRLARGEGNVLSLKCGSGSARLIRQGYGELVAAAQ